MIKRVDLFEHDSRDKNAAKGNFSKVKDKESFHIWPYEGTPHPVSERHDNNPKHNKGK